MRIYADTSFLVSLLYPGDKKHGAAFKYFAARQGESWLTSDWSLFETFNTLRQLCLSGADPQSIEGIRRLFKHWHRHGAFSRAEADWPSALATAQQLSAARASALRMRSADVLHIALLEELDPDMFVTRDGDQHALAIAAGWPSMLLP